MKVDYKIADGQEEQGSNDLNRQDCCGPAPKVSRCFIGVAEPLPDEDGSFEVEEVDRGEDVGEPCIHRQEEHDSSEVLYVTDFVSCFVNVEDDGQDCKEDGLDDFEHDVQGLSELVDPVSFEDANVLYQP